MGAPAVETKMAEQTLSKIEELKRIVQDSLLQQGLQREQIALLAMHLTEIEEEADRYLGLLRTVYLAQTPDQLLDALTEVLLSLYHLTPHAQEAQPLLEETLGLFDPEDNS